MSKTATVKLKTEGVKELTSELNKAAKAADNLEDTLEETAEFANYLGGFLATMKGATPEYSLDELEHFILSHRERTRVEISFSR